MSAMTEAEANGTWCPFVRSQLIGLNEDGTVGTLSNRDAAQLVSSDDKKIFTHNCIGRKCMSWRWSREKETAAFLADVQKNMQDNSVDFAKATQAVWKDKAGSYLQTEGFCGLAGKP